MLLYCLGSLITIIYLSSLTWQQGSCDVNVALFMSFGYASKPAY